MRNSITTGILIASALSLLAGGCGDDTDPIAPQNTSPTACFMVTPSEGPAAAEFLLDASCSEDNEDPTPVLEVRWDWENDGTWDTAWTTTKTASHQYATSGTKTIRLQVKDTGGLTAETTRSVTVSTDPPNTPPTACFLVSPSVGTTETLFQVDAFCSSDNEDPADSLQVRWDWENNGTWDTAWTTTKTASHQYATSGTKTIRLQVKDTGGLTSETTRSVTVAEQLPPNTPPTACFWITPYEGTTATEFLLDASCSQDNEDPSPLLQVRWDCEDDGVWDTSFTSTKTASHRFLTAGTKTVRLQVRDTGGLTAETTRDVTVHPADPPFLCLEGTVATPCNAGRVVLAGDLAFVTGGPPCGLQIVSVADPSAPEVVGTYSSGGQLWVVALDIQGNYAYIGECGQGAHAPSFLRILDVTHPSNPVLVGSISTPGSPWGVVVAGSLAYVVTYHQGLFIIDVSTPAHPQLVGTASIHGEPRDLRVSGHYAYIAHYYGGMSIVDVSNPENPTVVSRLSTRGRAMSVNVLGGLAFIGDFAPGGLHVVDVSNPASPAILGSVDISDQAAYITLVGHYAYVACWNSGLSVVDWSNPSAPQVVSEVGTPGTAMGTAYDEHIYVGDGSGGLRIYSLSCDLRKRD